MPTVPRLESCFFCSSSFGRDASDAEPLRSITGDGASIGRPVLDGPLEGLTGNDSGAEVNSVISDADNLSILSSVGDFEAEVLLVFPIFSSGISWSSRDGNVFDIGRGDTKVSSLAPVPKFCLDFANDSEWLFPLDLGESVELLPTSFALALTVKDGEMLRGEGVGDGDGSWRTSWTAKCEFLS